MTSQQRFRFSQKRHPTNVGDCRLCVKMRAAGSAGSNLGNTLFRTSVWSSRREQQAIYRYDILWYANIWNILLLGFRDSLKKILKSINLPGINGTEISEALLCGTTFSSCCPATCNFFDGELNGSCSQRQLNVLKSDISWCYHCLFAWILNN